jgi:hypothetical protein
VSELESLLRGRIESLIEKLKIYQGSATNIQMINRLTGLDEAAFLELTDELRDLAGVETEEPPQGIVMYTMMMFAAGAILAQERVTRPTPARDRSGEWAKGR